MDAAKNFAKGVVSQGYDDTATSIVLITGDGARFPVAPFNAVWWNATDFPDPADDPSVEIVRVIAKSTDTLTIERGQEGTGGIEHDDDGKVYRLIAPLTAKSINEETLPAVLSGNDWTVVVPDTFQVDATGPVILNAGAQFRANPSSSGVVIDLLSGVAAMGDVDGNNSGVTISADDNLGQCSLKGKIGTDQSAAATTPGTVTKKLQIFDLSGNSLGFIAIYNAIT